MMFGHSPDYTHHTSEDTPDKVDPVELERSEIIATATMLYLSDLSEEDAVDLVYLVGAKAAGRLGAAARRARHVLGDEALTPDWASYEAYLTVRHAAAGEREAVRSVLHFNDGESVRAAVSAVETQLTQQEEAALNVLAEHPDIASIGAQLGGQDRRVAVRTTRGPLDFGLPASKLPPDAAAWYSSDEFTLNGSLHRRGAHRERDPRRARRGVRARVVRGRETLRGGPDQGRRGAVAVRARQRPQ
jgi:hypothetical protein